MAERDYTRFLKEEQRLNVKLIPRPVYIEMVTRHRNKADVVDIVFDDHFWLWDLNQLSKKAESEGRAVTRGELADEMLSEMSDGDWWKTIAAFEEHLIGAFHVNPTEWAEFLDPVYDMQERDGWIQRQ